jgi:hypothetical protein
MPFCWALEGDDITPEGTLIFHPLLITYVFSFLNNLKTLSLFDCYVLVIAMF